MKRVLLLSAVFGLQLVLKAQKVYFIYLQSESTAPFYIKMAGKIKSSTTEGYLVIPKLTDSTYLITIGQPGKSDEPRFAVTINRSDRGFLIKNFDGTTGLFDLQTLSVYKPLTVEAITQTPAKNDNFTKLLAKAADDTTLLSHQTIEQKVKPKDTKAEVAARSDEIAKKQDTIRQSQQVADVTDIKIIATPSTQNDTIVRKETEVVTIPEKKTVAITNEEERTSAVHEEFKRSVITKKSESSTSEGFGLVFLDDYQGTVDTIQLVIPNPKIILPDTTQQKPAETKQFLEIVNEKEGVKKDGAEGKKVENAVREKQKPQCTSLSTDDDFFKLRRDMVSKNTQDEMIAQARKYFRGKCFRTEQIKYLSTLFLTDEAKYHFFDAAFMHVSDQEKFSSLQSEILDSYYLNRFKALIGE